MNLNIYEVKITKNLLKKASVILVWRIAWWTKRLKFGVSWQIKIDRPLWEEKRYQRKDERSLEKRNQAKINFRTATLEIKNWVWSFQIWCRCGLNEGSVIGFIKRISKTVWDLRERMWKSNQILGCLTLILSLDLLLKLLYSWLIVLFLFLNVLESLFVL